MSIYAIITPARNEESEIGKTILSVIAQTVQPAEWVIVDDGSGDGTGAVIDRYARDFPWITAVHHPDRGYRSPGMGVMEAFYAGYDALRVKNWDFLVKLDADMTLEPDYFRNCLRHFEIYPELGIGGGTIYEHENGKSKIEVTPHFHVRGATKIYRRACWEAIEGLQRVLGWDTLDEVKANMLHWQTRSFEDVLALQRRPTGFRQGTWADNVKNGRAAYISGYHPLFMFLKCLRRLLLGPYVLGSVALGLGYLTAALKGLPQVQDRELRTYLREQQLRSLYFGESIWR